MNIDEFSSAAPNVQELQREFPEITGKCEGIFAGQPNVYKFTDGNVVSWELLRGKSKNPTYGMIPPGQYVFPVAHKETVTVLEGDLEVKTEAEWEVMGKGNTITVDANKELRLQCKGTVRYFCEYD